MRDSQKPLESIFSEAAEMSGEDRAAFLQSACANDPTLRRDVDRLLRALDQSGSFLSQKENSLANSPSTPFETAGSANASQVNLLTQAEGQQIGRYKLLEKIGEGGCGMVYMAEQEEPVRRKVALKIIKAGMDSRQVIARFEAERQAMAMMDHPNIAQFFDAGTTKEGKVESEGGRIPPTQAAGAEADPSQLVTHNETHNSQLSPGLPYFVMELVRGVRITDYCTQNNLPTRQRLDLFIQVCHAVQHAHQKGIIHRDLKPSNILVTENDGKPVPKVIDFGIAKATEGQLTDKTVFTQFAAFMGTPHPPT
jgi:hypothetical protein